MFDLLISHQTISHSNKHSKTNPPHWHFIKQDVFTWESESESESAEQTLQASTMVSYKKTQKRKQTHHGKWVTKNAKGAMKRKGNIVDDASNVAKKALPEGWCGKVVKIQLWVLVAVTVSLASFLPLLLLFRFSSKRQQLENCNCRSIQTSTVPLFVTTLVMHKGLYLKKNRNNVFFYYLELD